MKVLDGKKIAAEIIQEIKAEVDLLVGRKPGLAFILVGDNAASQSYVRAKQKACAKAGIHSFLLEFPSSISQQELLVHIETLNRDPAVDGLLVQLPLPPQISEAAINLAIDPTKDADGFHPLNVGKMLLGHDTASLPCTPHGIQVLLARSGVQVRGKHVVIVGRSNIVGKPLAAILMQKKQDANATVTICHSQSDHLAHITKMADILVAAIGQPGFIRKEMVKEGAVVVDVGISRVDGKIVGDVDFPHVAPLTSHISPVPGGVGPMTIAMLLQNVLANYKARLL